jgi:cytoskeleton protein RodZ
MRSLTLPCALLMIRLVILLDRNKTNEVVKVGSFGERLRREREMRGISLDEIVATTKIGRRLLVALEEEQFELLPGGIFNKSYVRAYAKCVGIDEDEAVAEYLQAANEDLPDTRVIAQQHASIHSNRPVQRSGFPVMPVLILVVVVAGGIGGWKVYRDHQNERQKREPSLPADASSPSPVAAAPVANNAQPATPEPSAAQSSQTSLASSAVKAATPPSKPISRSAETTLAQPVTVAPPAATAPAGTLFEITVRPKETAWVSIKSDGKYVVRGIIKPPDVRTIRATNQVIFFTGNAGAVNVAFNGKNVPVAGGINDEQTLVFDSRGVLASPQPKTGAQ